MLRRTRRSYNLLADLNRERESFKVSQEDLVQEVDTDESSSDDEPEEYTSVKLI